MSLVSVPLQVCSLLAVAELKDVLMRTVAWLPAVSVPALTPRTEQNSNIVNTTNLRNVITFFFLQRIVTAIHALEVPNSNPGNSPSVHDSIAVRPYAFCYTLSTGKRRN